MWASWMKVFEEEKDTELDNELKDTNKKKSSDE